MKMRMKKREKNFLIIIGQARTRQEHGRGKGEDKAGARQPPQGNQRKGGAVEGRSGRKRRGGEERRGEEETRSGGDRRVREGKEVGKEEEGLG